MDKDMISMYLPATRRQTHPLNFFAGFAGSMKSDGESPCENRDSAHRTYLVVSLLSYIPLSQLAEQSTQESTDQNDIPSILNA
jgi:hypothetical protein